MKISVKALWGIICFCTAFQGLLLADIPQDLDVLKNARRNGVPDFIQTSSGEYKAIQDLARAGSFKAQAWAELEKWILVRQPVPQSSETFPLHSLYPAANSLMAYGDEAIPYFRSALESASTRDEAVLMASCLRVLYERQSSGPEDLSGKLVAVMGTLHSQLAKSMLGEVMAGKEPLFNGMYIGWAQGAIAPPADVERWRKEKDVPAMTWLLLQSKWLFEKQEACHALYEFGDRSAIPALAKALEDNQTKHDDSAESWQAQAEINEYLLKALEKLSGKAYAGGFEVGAPQIGEYLRVIRASE